MIGTTELLEPLEDHIPEGDLAGDDLSNRIEAAVDHRQDARPTCEGKAVDALEGKTLHRPEMQVRQYLLRLDADLCDRSVVAHGIDASVEAGLHAGTFDCRIDAETVLSVASDDCTDVVLAGIENDRSEIQALELAAARGIRLADKDFRGAKGGACKHGKCADRTAA